MNSKEPGYPIVEERILRPVSKSGIIRGIIRGSRRDIGELPTLIATQVLVYRVGQDLHVDPGSLGPDDPTVVDATSVLVVDLRRGVLVTVEFRLASAEAEEFTVRASFACHVTDVHQVVRSGVPARDDLLSYLSMCPKVHSLGQALTLSQIAEMREAVVTQIRAYLAIRPPVISGLEVTEAGIDVLTPADVREQEQMQRVKLREHQEAIELREREQRLAVLDLELQYERERKKRLYENDNAKLTQQTSQDRALADQMFKQDSEQRSQQSELELQGKRAAAARREVQQDIDVYQHDPRAAAALAHHRGELSSEDYAAWLGKHGDRVAQGEREANEWAREEERWQAERTDLREAAERADRLLEIEREQKRLELEHAALLQQNQTNRDDERWKLERDDRRDAAARDAKWQQDKAKLDQQALNEQLERAERDRKVQMSFELRKAAIAKGYGDSGIVQIERLVNTDAPAATNDVGRTPSQHPAIDGGLEEGAVEAEVVEVSSADSSTRSTPDIDSDEGSKMDADGDGDGDLDRDIFAAEGGHGD